MNLRTQELPGYKKYCFLLEFLEADVNQQTIRERLRTILITHLDCEAQAF